MKLITIKICESNEAAKHTDLLSSILENYEHINVVREKCLNRCSFCEDTPYVLINNGVEFGDDMEELIANIKEAISSNRK